MTNGFRGIPRTFPALPRAASGRRLAALLIALAVATLVSAPARAAVPMCSSDGRSMIAPPAILPWKMQTLEAPAPCPQPDNLLFQSLPSHEHQQPSSPPTPAAPRAVPVRSGALASPLRTRARELLANIPRGSELVDTLYRPPRI